MRLILKGTFGLGDSNEIEKIPKPQIIIDSLDRDKGRILTRSV
jgi:hypothetical protein